MTAFDDALPLALFDYPLPEAAIAHHPVEPRDHSRLMVLKGAQQPVHQHFYELSDWLEPGSLLLLNRTKVLPARLFANKPTTGRVELLLHTPVDGPVSRATSWLALARPAKGLREGMVLSIAAKDPANPHSIAKQPLEVVVGGRAEDGSVEIRCERPLLEVMEACGEIPLPPYIKRNQADMRDTTRYQTLFAQEPGAVAAPTASLHFTDRTFAALKARGVECADVILHVGPGTFLPVRSEHQGDVRNHVMHKESYVVPEAAQEAIARAKRQKRRIVAAGTTALRAVESWALSQAAEAQSDLFIYPGFKFKVVDGLLTNFHLPKSTLIMLVSALIERQRLMDAYATALKEGYRFFSYGDAMLVLP